MVDVTFIFMILAVALLGTMMWETLNNNLTQVRAQTDGRTYWVQNLPDRQAAADLLGNIQLRVLRVVDHCAGLEGENFQRLASRYRPESLQENVQYAGGTSYSENKGERIVLCLRTKDAAHQLQDIELLMFVVLHELAHLMTNSLDTGRHSPEFWHNFKKLLEVAAGMGGIYDPVDYSTNPQTYCGMMIDSSPVFEH